MAQMHKMLAVADFGVKFLSSSLPQEKGRLRLLP